MKKYIVTLQTRSRFAKPKIGLFEWTKAHNRHVFRGKEAANCAELAALVNEAVDYLRRLNNPFLLMEVREVAVADPSPSEPDNSEPDSAGRRKLTPRNKKPAPDLTLAST